MLMSNMAEISQSRQAESENRIGKGVVELVFCVDITMNYPFKTAHWPNSMFPSTNPSSLTCVLFDVNPELRSEVG